MNLNDIFIKSSDKVFDALQKIECSKYKICLVVDEHDKLIGTVTDGDIRRSFLSGSNVGSEVSQVMNQNPITMLENDDPQVFIESMQKGSFLHLPVVSQDGKVCRILMLSDLTASIMQNRCAIIMAGGLGMRLRPLTEHVPKPMLVIDGRPILHHLINHLKNNGIFTIYICVNYKKEVIKKYFQDGKNFGVDIVYIEEDKPLGTAGALGLIGTLSDSSCLVLNADLITKVDFDSLFLFHESHGQDATICIRQHHLRVPYGVIEANNEGYVQKIVEKPIQSYFINAGIYVLNPKLFHMILENHYLDMPEYLHLLISKGYGVKSFVCYEEWLDVGSKDDMAKAQKLIIY